MLCVSVALVVACVVGAVLALGCGVLGSWWCSMCVPCLWAAVVGCGLSARVVGLVPTLGVGCLAGVGVRGGWCGCPPLLLWYTTLLCSSVVVCCCVVLCDGEFHCVSLPALACSAALCAMLPPRCALPASMRRGGRGYPGRAAPPVGAEFG